MKSIHWLLSSVLVAALAPAASASPATSKSDLIISPDVPVIVIEAQSREHVDGTRVAYHVAEAEIARRDLMVARFEEARTRAHWNVAVAQGHPNPAGYWAQRHAAAAAELRDADGRWLNERSERNIALDDFRYDWDQLHRLSVASHRAIPRS